MQASFGHTPLAAFKRCSPVPCGQAGHMALGIAARCWLQFERSKMQTTIRNTKSLLNSTMLYNFQRPLKQCVVLKPRTKSPDSRSETIQIHAATLWHVSMISTKMTEQSTFQVTHINTSPMHKWRRPTSHLFATKKSFPQHPAHRQFLLREMQWLYKYIKIV